MAWNLQADRALASRLIPVRTEGRRLWPGPAVGMGPAEPQRRHTLTGALEIDDGPFTDAIRL